MARSTFAHILVPLLAVAFLLLPLHHAWGAAHHDHGGADTAYADAVPMASSAADDGCGQAAPNGQAGDCVFCATCVSVLAADSAEPIPPLPLLTALSIGQSPSRAPAPEPRPPRLPLA
ncbi:hypothetical protein Mlg_1387 [Alkalilimnicola ehrlichii MLHE-1]|uniref:DUF2946 domain-containing protein n=1 Tax=Alkalilimnicola ehrlichii (strain ATCC BAA-1101 / DSM 17681 / MLHE-1) TaxID=187272 RepID=Q0A8V1_ALKEH|nr:hypothetical protein Mlg_1387 [Alkalilimnicola ehrlichii MLHE-1]